VQEARVLAAAQKPIAARSFTDPAGPPAWRTLPSWFLVSTRDRMINPDLERFMAARIGATTVEVRSSHASPVSHPTWADKYKDQGLLVIGVHTPEFDFEHDPDNLRRAATNLRVDYPIAVDNDYAIWDAFGNRYWPALYFADAKGQLRHHHFGEGDYQQSEMVIQRLLTQAGSGGIGHELVSVDARGVEATADWDSLWSPENYLGYARTENFASSNGAVLDTPARLCRPRAVGPEPVGPCRELDGQAAGSPAGQDRQAPARPDQRPAARRRRRRPARHRLDPLRPGEHRAARLPAPVNPTDPGNHHQRSHHVEPPQR
jgi:hypothetical protein